MPRASTLIVDRGDLPSLAACSQQSQPEAIVLWHLVEMDAAAARRREAIERHGAARRIDRIVISTAPELGVPGMAPPPELFQAAVLLQAVTVARQIGCPRIVWPLVVGPDREAVARARDRATTVAGLGSPPSGEPAAAIEMPLLELTDHQVVELAGVAPGAAGGFWPCNEGGEVPCRRCDACRRWLAAFHLCGRTWPWRPPVGLAAA